MLPNGTLVIPVIDAAHEGSYTVTAANDDSDSEVIRIVIGKRSSISVL